MPILDQPPIPVTVSSFERPGTLALFYTVTADSGIVACSIGDAVLLRLMERGCFKNSPCVENFVHTKADEGQRRFVMDLQQCAGMDSTFMGMLIGLGKWLGKKSGVLNIVNAGGKNGNSLKTLGVHYFCEVCEDAGGFDLKADGEKVAAPVVTKDDQTRHCLRAHETLATVSDANEQKFKDVICIMRDQCPGEQL